MKPGARLPKPDYQPEYFQAKEYACPCCGLNNMDADFLRRLDLLRGLCGFPLVLTSGCRCARHNKNVGGGLYSAHLDGVAVDIACFGYRGWVVLQYAFSLGFTGIGLMQHGAVKSRFIHLDSATTIDGKRPRPTVWTY